MDYGKGPILEDTFSNPHSPAEGEPATGDSGGGSPENDGLSNLHDHNSNLQLRPR